MIELHEVGLVEGLPPDAVSYTHLGKAERHQLQREKPDLYMDEHQRKENS